MNKSSRYMAPDYDSVILCLAYSPGLDRVQEAVISSHFMQELARNRDLDLYDERGFAVKSLEIDVGALCGTLIPGMLRACGAFCLDRAAAAKRRARENHEKYALSDPRTVGTAEIITEVMFDRHYRRGPREGYSRQLLREKVKRRVEAGCPIEMVIPALPFKLPSPLKSRGRLPDLAEVNFLLGLYEIAATVELIYREAEPHLRGRVAGFTVVSDGNRFNKIVDDPESAVEGYLAHLGCWIDRLKLNEYITLFDYQTLLRERLPATVWEAKSAIARTARAHYADTMWPVFDPYDMVGAMSAAARLEPDPESSNPQGRFVSLLKSLVFTINYKALRKFGWLPGTRYAALYRELTAHIFEPYAVLTPAELVHAQSAVGASAELPLTNDVKEYLRRLMLEQVWNATIEYIAEIKSDRELKEDPILTCLPDYIRWTIHAKPGQLAILSPTAFGTAVQAWAGAAVFKRTKKGEIKLCTLPVLALEGAGAIPVRVRDFHGVQGLSDQPLFYIYPDVAFTDLDEFLDRLRCSLVRKRTD